MSNDNTHYVYTPQGGDMDVEAGSFQEYEFSNAVDTPGVQNETTGYDPRTVAFVRESQHGLGGRRRPRTTKSRRTGKVRTTRASQAVADFDRAYNRQHGGNTPSSNN